MRDTLINLKMYILELDTIEVKWEITIENT
jgi:hypothetical protein